MEDISILNTRLVMAEAKIIALEAIATHFAALALASMDEAQSHVVKAALREATIRPGEPSPERSGELWRQDVDQTAAHELADLAERIISAEDRLRRSARGLPPDS